MMSKLIAWLRGEPVLVTAVATIVIAWVTTKFHLSKDQVAIIWSALAAVFGIVVRQQVSPTA